MAFPVHFQAQVKEIIKHNNNLVTYILEPVTRIPKFKPGQFMHLTIDKYDTTMHWPDSRAFSIASAPSLKQQLRLTIGRQGLYTNRIIDEVKLNSILDLKGPYGEFCIATPTINDPIVLIAGGTGITPFISYLEDFLYNTNANYQPTTLFYGAQNQHLLLYKDLLEQVKTKHNLLNIHYYVESNATAPINLGRLSIAQIVAKLPSAQIAHYFLSGPKNMISSFSKELTLNYNVAPFQIHSDSWE